MGQFVGAIEGMGDACRSLDFPVVSGNVSLYNETNGIAIPPTPAIGGVGIIRDVNKTATISLSEEGLVLFVLGKTEGHLGQTLYLDILHGRREGAPPPVDLQQERKTGDFVRALIQEGKANAVHDCSDGGLLVAAAEMALAGRIGIQLKTPDTAAPRHAFWFGEDQGRYVVAASSADAEITRKRAEEQDIFHQFIGHSGGKELTLDDEDPISIETLSDAHEACLPGLMGRESGSH